MLQVIILIHSIKPSYTTGYLDLSIAGGDSIIATSPNPIHTTGRVIATETPLRARTVEDYDSPSWTVLENEESEKEDDQLQGRTEAKLPKIRQRRGKQDTRVPAGLTSLLRFGPTASECAILPLGAESKGPTAGVEAGPSQQVPVHLPKVPAQGTAHAPAPPPTQVTPKRRTIFDGVVITTSPKFLKKTTKRPADNEYEKVNSSRSRVTTAPPTRATLDHSHTPRTQRDNAAGDLASALAAAFANNSQLVAAFPASSPPAFPTHDSSRGAHEAAKANAGAGVAPRELRQPPSKSVHGKASAVYWHIVDEGLESTVAPGVVLQRYAQHPGPERETQLRHTLDEPGVNKGKAREWSAYTHPRWSRIANFKEKLDSLFGPGDITRAVGKQPRPARRDAEDESNMSDSNGSESASWKRSVEDEAVVEGSSEIDMVEDTPKTMKMNAQGGSVKQVQRAFRWADEL
ncbi:hypothetical protein BKA93DRAFT_823981 [Sparassis latifolia]